MSPEAYEAMPDELKACDRYYFEAAGTWYLVKAIESDISQLVWIDGKGTCLDTSLERIYELRLYEISPVPEQPGYFDLVGLSGQFKDRDELCEYVGIDRSQLKSKLSPGRLYIWR